MNLWHVLDSHCNQITKCTRRSKYITRQAHISQYLKFQNRNRATFSYLPKVQYFILVICLICPLIVFLTPRVFHLAWKVWTFQTLWCFVRKIVAYLLVLLHPGREEVSVNSIPFERTLLMLMRSRALLVHSACFWLWSLSFGLLWCTSAV